MIVVWIESEVQNAANYTTKAGNLHIQEWLKLHTAQHAFFQKES